MMQQIQNHSDIGVDKLLAQFKDKPKIDAMIRMQTDQLQDIENAGFELYQGRALQTAFGFTLDRWGNLLNEPRSGRNDETYRAALFFKITRNVARGTPEDMITIFLVLSGAQLIKYFEDYPATVFLIGIGVSPEVNFETVAPYIKASAPAGVKIGQLTYSAAPLVFGFAGFPSDLLGPLGDLNNPGVGGFLASNIQV